MLHAISNRVIWDEGGGPSHTTKFNPFEIAPSGLTTVDRKSTRLNSSHGYISYAVFCLKKKKKKKINFSNIKKKKTVYVQIYNKINTLFHTSIILQSYRIYLFILIIVLTVHYEHYHIST